MVVGVTGGIGSGKSVVCRIFSLLGVPVFNADLVAKKLYRLEEVKNQLSDLFGKEIIDGKGEVDLKKLGQIIFADEKKLEQVNQLIHPMVKNEFLSWSEQQDVFSYQVIESAILFESSFYRECDKIIAVTCPESLRILRVMHRDSRTEKEVKTIIANQFPQQRLIDKSDYEILNDDKQLVIPVVLNIHAELLSLSLNTSDGKQVR